MSLGDSPIVQIKDGKLQGFISKAEDDSAKPVFNYLNIPFGKPPTGKRRFMPPEKSESWDGVRDAKTNLYNPIQDAEVARTFDDYLPMKKNLGSYYDRQDEDCLYLNVFTTSTEKSAKLPVMFWIVGGAFMRSTAGSYDGVALSGMNDVVVVTPNYRVNALGFLSLGQGTKCPGNNGLLDLILALKWVRDNIADFGGDPNNVTIFGESAGGCLVELFMMSPLAAGLFHKAIAMSGSALASPLFGDGELLRNKLLSDLNIPLDDDPDVILEKLQALSNSKLVEIQKPFQGLFTFKPNVDGVAITDTPQNLLRAGKVAPVPFINGVCDVEGGGLLCITQPKNFFAGCTIDDLTEVFGDVVEKEYPDADKAQATQMLIASYSSTKDDKDNMKYTKIYSEVLSDSVFIVPAVMSTTAHAAMQRPTFFYKMRKSLEFNHSNTNGKDIKNKPDFVTCDHGDTCHYIWGVPFVKGELPGGAWFTKEEAEFSRVTMKYLTNFAKNGDPSIGAPVPTEWPKYDLATRKSIILDEEVVIEENFGMQAVKLYNEDIPQMMKTISKV